MITFETVTKTFGSKTPKGDNRRQVLKGVDFTLKRGELICLLGPSGCGKTTMINMIMGKLLPTTGTVTVMGERAPYKAARPRIGYMPQEDALYTDINGEENLIFFGRMNGMKKAEARARAAEMLAFGRLAEDGKKMISEYSGGMKKRLSLGIAMMHEPELLILDEPTVGLDPDHRRRIWHEFEKLADGGTTILVTTHVMDEAMRCGKIAMLYDGQMIAQGSPADILADTGCEDLEDAFLAMEARYE